MRKKEVAELCVRIPAPAKICGPPAHNNCPQTLTAKVEVLLSREPGAICMNSHPPYPGCFIFLLQRESAASSQHPTSSVIVATPASAKVGIECGQKPDSYQGHHLLGAEQNCRHFQGDSSSAPAIHTPSFLLLRRQICDALVVSFLVILLYLDVALSFALQYPARTLFSLCNEVSLPWGSRDLLTSQSYESVF